MNLSLDLLPPRVRQVVYAVFALTGAGLTAAGAYFFATTGVTPAWVLGGLAALGTLGILPNSLAATNVTPKDTDTLVYDSYTDHETLVDDDAPVVND